MKKWTVLLQEGTLKNKLVSLLLVVLMMLSVATGCAKNTGEPVTSTASVSTAATPVKGDVIKDDSRILKLYVNQALPTLDPDNTTSLKSKWIIKQIYEGLIYFDYGTSKVTPRLSESYDMSKDGLTWTFHLRKNVKFHNGDSMKASDVVFSYNRAIADPAMASYIVGIDTVKASDDNTVVITLKSTVVAFLQNVSEIPIVNEKFVTANGGKIAAVTCGTGPYMTDSVDLAVKVTASAFKDYYGTAPNIKKINWDIITDSATAALAFESGNLDYSEIDYSRYKTYSTNKDIQLGVCPTRHSIYISFNVSKPPFDNVLVRQAICYLVDRNAVNLVTYEGQGEVDSLLMSGNLVGMPSKDVLKKYTYEYNPEKGLALLKQAGYDTTKEIDLGSIKTYPESHYASKPTLVIQEDLAKYNIKLKIETMEINAFANDLYARNYTMACAAGSYGYDVGGWLNVWGKDNQFGWADKYYDEFYKQFTAGISEIDPTKRQAIYADCMRILYEQAPGTNMSHKYLVVAWHNDLAPIMRTDYTLVSEWNWIKK